MVENLPCSSGYMGSILGQGTKTPHAVGQLSPPAARREAPTHSSQRKATTVKTQHNPNKYIYLKKRKQSRVFQYFAQSSKDWHRFVVRS